MIYSFVFSQLVLMDMCMKHAVKIISAPRKLGNDINTYLILLIWDMPMLVGGRSWSNGYHQ